MKRSASKRVLIISYYWPPCGGVGVLRILKFAKYLRAFDWEPVVFTAKDAHYPFLDAENLKEVPEGIEVIKGPIWEPYALFKKLTGKPPDANVNNIFSSSEEKRGITYHLAVWIRSNFFIPDARALWIKPSVRRLITYLESNPVDALISTGPPHSSTRIGTLLRKRLSIPWLADFQDPWTQVDYYQQLHLTPWANRKHHRWEQEAFQRADKITIVSPTWAKDLEAIGAKNVATIPLGYDPEDFPETEVALSPRFSLAHLGILGYDRHPRVLFATLARLKKEIPGFSNDLELTLAGQVDRTVFNSLKEHGLQEQTRFLGSVPRQEALAVARRATVLLLLINQQPNAKGRIPGKAFEYMAARRPIISIGPEEADITEIIREAGAGFGLPYDDEAKTYSLLKRLYRDFKDGRLNAPVDADIASFSVRELTGQIAGFLEEISAGREGRNA